MRASFYLWPQDGQWHLEEIGGMGCFGIFGTEQQAKGFVAAQMDLSGVTFHYMKPKHAA